MVTDSGRESGLRRFGRRLASLSRLALVPALLAVAPAQSAMLTNVGPRVPTNIGPRTPAIDSVGPRFDPGLHRTPGGGDSGGGSNNSGASSGGSTGGTANTGNSGGNSGGSRSQVTVRRTRSG